MKKLTDYEGDAAIDLWADLLDPITEILSDDKIIKILQAQKSKSEIAKEVLKLHKDEAVEILLRIDPAPLDGLNLILRLISIITDIGNNEEIRSFFGYALQAKKERESSGSVTESTEAEES